MIITMPHSSHCHHCHWKQHLDDNFTPPGTQIHSFTTEESRTFEVYKGTVKDSNVQKYFERLQPFVLWFIDAAWYIDTTDHKWDIFFLYVTNIRR